MKEEKEFKMSLSTFFLIIATIVIVVMGIYMYVEKTNVNKEIEELKANADNWQKQVQTIMNKSENKDEDVKKNTTSLNTSSDVESSNKKDSETPSDMSIELAYGILNKYKNENLPDANWYIGKVKLIAHGDNNTYWVSYEDKNLDGDYTEESGAIIEYKNGKWTTELPGFTGMSDEEISKYNFVNY